LHILTEISGTCTCRR